MKFNVWLQNDDDHEASAEEENTAEMSGYKVSRSAIAKWSSGNRIPRKDEMKMIKHLTRGEVTPNDFYEYENL